MIRELILDGSSQLIQEGLKSGFLYQLSEKRDKGSEPIALPLDSCSLSGLCDLAKRLPPLSEMGQRTLQLMEEDASVAEQDLFSRVIENNSSFSKMITLMGQKYLLPPKSSFLLSDISCIQPLLNCGKMFDVIVIDPPWQNKSVKRSNRYSYLSPLQIQQIPVPQLAAPDCLVITWVTNRQRHLRFVRDELYPSWSVETLAEWHWVKITKTGEFVFPLDSPHKKPYEGLILGRVQGKAILPSRGSKRLYQARWGVFGIVCPKFTAGLDQLGQRSSEISARGLFRGPRARVLRWPESLGAAAAQPSGPFLTSEICLRVIPRRLYRCGTDSPESQTTVKEGSG